MESGLELSVLGRRMILRALRGEDDGDMRDDPTRGWSLVVLGVAAGIDGCSISGHIREQGSRSLTNHFQHPVQRSPVIVGTPGSGKRNGWR